MNVKSCQKKYVKSKILFIVVMLPCNSKKMQLNNLPKNESASPKYL